MNHKRLNPQQVKLQYQLDKIAQAFRQYFAAGDYVAAMKEALKAHKLTPHALAPLSDAATAAVKGSLWDEGIQYAKKVLRLNPKHINAYDALAHAYGGKKDWANCREAGLRALQLRDEQYGAGVLPPLPVISPQSDGKKIIAFSLFGNSSAYGEPAVLNAELCPHIYPDWICRFYVDKSVPEHVLARLYHYGAEVVQVDAAMQTWPGTMWRFVAMDDDEAAYVLFRDADSVISQREAQAVAEWLASGKMFHTLRDAGTHTELILAGLWGAVAGAVPNMRGKIETWLQKPLASRHFADQFFLREEVWKYAKQSLCGHDRIFGFYDAQDFPNAPQPFDDTQYHVGCDEGNSHISAQLNLPEGSRIIWRLFSQVSPFINEDFSENLLPEERLVCAYESTVQNGQLSAYIPRRYSRGVARGLTKMTVAAL